MEIDIDRLPRDAELFTHVPEFEAGHLVVPDRPGWGTEPDENAMKDYPPKIASGLQEYARQSRQK